ncbi:MAG: Tad domain-containing protein [Acidimicrobiia bacterium]|nr:Tad domain-containing protein [Acidimicrobiia bacterium]
MKSRGGSTRPRRDEAGSVIILFALSLAFIVLVAAIAIDLAMVRNDRADNQVAVDSAATAGVVGLTENGGIVGCQHALDYLETTTGSVTSGANCSGLPDRCWPTTPSASTTGTVGNLTVTIVHPVDDTDPLMRPGAVGAPNLGVHEDDGDRCERLGVTMTETHGTFFGGTLGITELTSVVHAVALDGTDRSPNRMANLVVLERHDCDALASSTSSGSGGIRVAAVTDGSGNVFPGRIAVDSDGTGSRCGSKGTINTSGTNALIQADGPPGCAGALDAFGAGCGVVETFAPGTPGCLMPACSGSGSINPNPTQMDRRVTRAAVDHRWNCKAAYPAGYDIEGCYYAGFVPPYIDQLTTAVGSSGIPSGFRSYKDAGHPCLITSGSTVVIPRDNWVVDCQLTINGTLRFLGGNTVFDQAVSVQSNGRLAINDANTGSYTWTDRANLNPTQSSGDAAFAYLRSGQLFKAGQATISMKSTLVYVAPGAYIDIAGGSGALQWTAPSTGPFENLALWSDSDVTNRFGGQTNLVMEGIFFAPLATMTYVGNGAQKQIGAQYVVRKLTVSGQGELILVPDASNAIAFPLPWPTVLIR